MDDAKNTIVMRLWRTYGQNLASGADCQIYTTYKDWRKEYGNKNSE
jgi:hypothetical protein